MKNFISHNIRHLCEKEKLSQNEFGEIFGLGKSVVSMYISEKSIPKLETLQLICEHFKISLDDFVNRNLKTQRIEEIWSGGDIIKEPLATPGLVETLRGALDDKDKIIKMLEEEVKRLRGGQNHNSKTA